METRYCWNFFLCKFLRISKLIVPQNYWLHFFNNRKFSILTQFGDAKSWVLLLSTETWFAEIESFLNVFGCSKCYNSWICRTTDFTCSIRVAVDSFLHLEISSVDILQYWLLWYSYRLKMAKCAIVVTFLKSNSTIGCSSCIKVSLNSFIFSDGDSKMDLGCGLCFGTLIKWYCQQMQTAVVEMMFVENPSKISSNQSRFLKKSQKLIVKHCYWAKDMPELAAVLFTEFHAWWKRFPKKQIKKTVTSVCVFRNKNILPLKRILSFFAFHCLKESVQTVQVLIFPMYRSWGGQEHSNYRFLCEKNFGHEVRAFSVGACLKILGEHTPKEFGLVTSSGIFIVPKSSTL